MLHSLRPAKGSRPNKKRVARGNSAGGGTTAGRGTKRSNSPRSGAKRRFGFEGGQTPLLIRQPKLGGFKNPNRIKYEVINLATLEANLDAGTYTPETLKTAKVLSTKRPVKVLGMGNVTKKFEITVHAASKAAIAAIKEAGGSVKVL